MSDSDADDSSFDREAERERLREKYESEQEDREQTQRMSELLLQGATMTNQHCDTCGNPIFRYDGQEFCAVCQQPTDAPAGDQARGQDTATDTPEAPDATQSASPSQRTPQSPEDVSDDTADRPVDGRDSTPAAEGSTTVDQGERDRTGGEDSIATARASLTRTLTSITRQAEAAEDVRRTREYLEAARDAADALAALDQLR